MRRKIITLSVVVCMIVSMAAYSASATPFLTHLLQCVVSCVENTSGSSKTLYAKATLTSGTGGVWVQIRNYSGDSVIKKKLFPYQDTSVGPVSNTVSAGDRRKLYVKPNTTGQTVTGNLDYYFQ